MEKLASVEIDSNEFFEHLARTALFVKESFDWKSLVPNNAVSGGVTGAALGGVGNVLARSYVERNRKVKPTSNVSNFILGALGGGALGAGAGYLRSHGPDSVSVNVNGKMIPADVVDKTQPIVDEIKGHGLIPGLSRGLGDPLSKGQLYAAGGLQTLKELVKHPLTRYANGSAHNLQVGKLLEADSARHSAINNSMVKSYTPGLMRATDETMRLRASPINVANVLKDAPRTLSGSSQRQLQEYVDSNLYDQLREPELNKVINNLHGKQLLNSLGRTVATTQGIGAGANLAEIWRLHNLKSRLEDIYNQQQLVSKGN